MNKRIEIWNSTITSDAGGNTETSVKVADVWARVNQLSQARSFQYGITENYKNYEITIRYRSDVNPKNWIIFNGKRLTIASILNAESNDIELVLIASEND